MGDTFGTGRTEFGASKRIDTNGAKKAPPPPRAILPKDSPAKKKGD